MKRKTLLQKYFNAGWLNKKYYSEKGYRQLYSAEDRLWAGTKLYADFVKWNQYSFPVRDYEKPKVDGGAFEGDMRDTIAMEKFRRVVKVIPPMLMPVIYKIVFEEQEIKPPYAMNTREKLYFYDEIKISLCRGLDAVAAYYQRLI